MLSSLLDLTNLGWSSSVSMMVPTTRLTNCLNEVVLPCRLKRIHTIQSSKRSSGLVRTGLQKQNKKDLSRILRTEHAIQGIERKANSSKYSRLWPKAVLEALDEAIRDNQHDSAVKVCAFILCWVTVRIKIHAFRASVANFICYVRLWMPTLYDVKLIWNIVYDNFLVSILN